jgi:hypothetical protein
MGRKLTNLGQVVPDDPRCFNSTLSTFEAGLLLMSEISKSPMVHCLGPATHC